MREVPLRRSLVLRLFGLVAAVAVVSVVVTAWLTVHTTAVGLRQEQGEAVRADARIADALTGYAATHPDWSGAGPVVRRLAASAGHRITVTDESGHVLADSSRSGGPLPRRFSATIDPLAVGPDVAPSPAVDCSGRASCPVGPASYTGPPPGDSPIDRRAVGPFALTASERAHSHALAEREVSCLHTAGADATVVVADSGRAGVAVHGEAAVPESCSPRVLLAPEPSEVAPLAALQKHVRACLQRRHGPVVTLTPSLGWTQTRLRTPAGDRLVESCLVEARRDQLTSYVAPAALLYVSNPRQQPTTILDLSAHNRWRIAEVALLVLLGCLAFAALAGRQLVRPLGTLADAARRMRAGDLSARADVRARDEIGSVARAFNTMAERRERAEALRRAQVGDVAHELRNPLSTIRGSLEAAQDGLVPTDAALVSSLLEETLLLQHVVEDLRDLAAADAGELRLERGPVALGDVVEQVVTAFRGDARSAGVSLAASVVGAPTVAGDALRLRQALGNLVSNALRHTPSGGRVDVEARAVAPDDGGGAELVVTDTGEGIAPADLEHVFERFWRADPSRTRASGGSGLGLAIVRQLAEAHGGTVSASSEVGRGSRFVVHLPAESP